MAIVPSLARSVSLKTRIAVDDYHADKGAAGPSEQAEALAQIGNWVRPVSQGEVANTLAAAVAATNKYRNYMIDLSYSKGKVILRELGFRLYRGDAAGALIYLDNECKKRSASDAAAIFDLMGEDDSGSTWDAMVYGTGEGKDNGSDFCPRNWEAGEAGSLPTMLDA